MSREPLFSPYRGFLPLLDYVEKEELISILEVTTRMKGRWPAHLLDVLGQTIGTIQIKGWRKGNGRPRDLAARLIRPALTGPSGPGLMSACLEMWRASELSLGSEIKEFLRVRGEEIVNWSNVKEGFIADRSTTEFDLLLDGFLSEHPDVPRWKVAVMLACTTGRIPSLKKMKPEAEPEEEIPWASWIEYLSSVRPTASDWDRAQDFFNKAQEIVRSKKDEAKAHSRLNDLLNDLRSNPQLVSTFETTVSVEWSPHDFRNDAEGAAQEMAELVKALSEYAEESRHRQRVELGNRVLAGLARLSERRTQTRPETPEISAPESNPERAIDADPEQREERLLTSNPLEDLPAVPQTIEGATKRTSGDIPSQPDAQDKSDVTPTNTSQVDEPEERAAYSPNRDSPGKDSVEAPKPTQVPADGEIVVISVQDAPEASQKVPHSQSSGVNELQTKDDLGTEPNVFDSLKTDHPSMTAGEGHELAQSSIGFEALRELVAKRDLPGVYWLCKSLEEAGSPSPVRSTLIAALQASVWVDAGTDRLIADLTELMGNTFPDPYNESEIIIGLAAALRPALFLQEVPCGDWLNAPDDCPQLLSLVEAVADFRASGSDVSLAQLPSVRARWERQEALESKKRAVSDWLNEIQRDFVDPTTIIRTNAKVESIPMVMGEWTAPDGPLGRLANTVIRGRLDEAGDFLEQLRDWEKPKHVLDRFHRRSAELLQDRHLQELFGSPRRNVEESIQEGVRLLKEWHRVAAEPIVPSFGNHNHKELILLRSRLSERLYPSLAEIQKKSASETAVCWDLLLKVLNNVAELFGLSDAKTDSGPPGKWFCAGAQSLDEALARRLLWCPHVRLLDSGLPDAGQSAAIATGILESDYPGAERAVSAWVAQGDFRFTELLLANNDSETLVEFVHDALARCRDELQRARQAVLEVAIQAHVDGVISEEERGRYTELLGFPPVGAIRNFPSSFLDALAARNELEKLRQTALDRLKLRWQSRRVELNARPDITLSVTGGVCEKVDSAIAGGLIRVAEELVNLVSEILDEGIEPDTKLLDLLKNWRDSERDVLNEFQIRMPSIADYLSAAPMGVSTLLDSWEMDKYPKAVSLPDSPARHAEAKTAIGAWQELKDLNSNDPKAPNRVLAITQFLGLAVPPGEGGAWLSKTISDQPGHLYMTARRTANEASPIPHFGSRTRIENRVSGDYQILCLWKEPNPHALEQILQLINWDNNTHLIIFYLGTLALNARNALASLCRRERLPLAILDDLLLLFLAGETDHRLRPFLECALAYCFVNPYAKEPHAPVDPEMFVGRKGAIEIVGDFRKSCVVFGGRQLGKTALLQRVKSRYNIGETRVIYQSLEFLKKEFEDGKTSALWDLLDRKLREVGVIRDAPKRGESVSARILKSLTANPPARVLLLLDEVDDFLNADDQNGFREVALLRDLMVDSNRRVKVVLAGNFHTQRFASANHPLTPFGEPIIIKQMTYPAACELVERPLRALGYRFDPEVLPSVFSHTFYYAGLIQLLLHELVEHCRTRLLDKSVGPPYRITTDMVDEVARNPEVRRKVRDRFRMTMDLDDDYGVLMYSIVLASPQGECPYFSAEDVLDLARTNWVRGFGNATLDTIKVRLLEMHGLGLLVTDESGALYRLRNSNLVRVFGSRGDVKRELRALTSKSATSKDNYEKRHAVLTDGSYSPLTRAQERLLMPTSSDVQLLFSSEATGLERLPLAFTRLVRGRDEEVDCRLELVRIPNTIGNSRALRSWVVDQLRGAEKDRSFVFYLRWHPSTLSDVLSVISEMEAVRRDNIQLKSRHARIVIILDPQACWKWSSRIKTSRPTNESSAVNILHTKPWDEYAIHRRLEDLDIDRRAEVCNRILRATGGWQILLDTLFERLPGSGDPLPEIDAFAGEVVSKGSPLAERLIAATGIWEAGDLGARALKWLASEGPIPVDYWTHDLVCYGALGNEAQCRSVLEFLDCMGLVRRLVHAQTGELELHAETLCATLCPDARVLQAAS